MKKILIGCLVASSVVFAKPYIGNYTQLLLTKEQTKNNIPKVTAYSLDDAVQQLNEFFQASNTNLRITTKEMKNKKLDQFIFSGGTLEKLIDYVNSKNIFVSKYNDVLFFKNSGNAKYEIGMYHSKKEIENLREKVKVEANAVAVKSEKFFNRDFFNVDASPYGQKIAKQMIEKDVRDQITKKERLKIEFKNGGQKVLVAGVRLDRPMTIQRFFKELGGQNLKTYIVHGNANVPMNDNVIIYDIKGLNRYLKNINGVKVKTHKDGKYIIVEVQEK